MMYFGGFHVNGQFQKLVLTAILASVELTKGSRGLKDQHGTYINDVEKKKTEDYYKHVIFF